MYFLYYVDSLVLFRWIHFTPFSCDSFLLAINSILLDTYPLFVHFLHYN